MRRNPSDGKKEIAGNQTARRSGRAAASSNRESPQLAANFISLMASKSCTPPPTRLVV
jgi:hypothetical protein